MNIRHLVTKSFDKDNKVRDSLIVEGVLYNLAGRDDVDSSQQDIHEVQVTFNENYPTEINLSKELLSGQDSIINSPIGEIISDSDNTIIPLSQLYDYKVKETDKLIEFLPLGTTFNAVFESPSMKQYMLDASDKMFPYTNPLTKEKDIDNRAYYASYIPLSVLTGIITPQIGDNGKAFFNPNGVVSVAEFLDTLNAINYGANSNQHRKKTIDNISDTDDYFNEGYQECLRGISSPFFNLYTREELMKPITRLELAYITVICWNRFIDKFNNIYSNPYYIGINFNWENPVKHIKQYEDGFDYKISQIFTNKELKILSLNIKDYKTSRSMTEYKNDIMSGKTAIPLPMFMSMIEIGIIKLFNYIENPNMKEGKLFLNPLQEVSRGELCYFASMLAKTFPTKYIKE